MMQNKKAKLLSQARAFEQVGNLQEAEKIYRTILAADKKNTEIMNHLAIANHGRGRHDEVVRWTALSLGANARQPDVYNTRGDALRQLKRYPEALECFDKAIALNPANAFAHYNRGLLFQDAKRYTEALASYDKAAELAPNDADIYNNRGVIFVELRRFDEAAANITKALALRPDYPYLKGLLLHLKMQLCDWQDINAMFETVARSLSYGHPLVPFHLVSTPLSAAQQHKCAELYVRDKYPPGAIRLWNGEKYTHERIRIGYFSADFQRHATADLMAHFFELHDRSRFEVTAFSFGPASDHAMRKRLEQAFERFVDVREQSDVQIAQLARSLEIDIAIDLKGFTQDCRPGIFALRPAPVQVNYLGYPGTMGAPYMDYLMADATLIPEDQRRFYSEKIVYLPHSYQVNDSTRPIGDTRLTRQEMGLPHDGFVFCCFNNNFKFTPDVFDVWMRLLGRIEGSVLWLLGGTETAMKNLRKEAQTRGISENRLLFAPYAESAEYLARYRLADLFLDTWHCNAHTTTSDALWTGVPVLTYLGNTFPSRVAASLLRAADLPELITASPEEYEARAAELASDRNRLATIRSKLERNRTTCPLFDTTLSTRHIEDAYVAMWKRQQAGQPADHIVIAEK